MLHLKFAHNLRCILPGKTTCTSLFICTHRNS